MASLDLDPTTSDPEILSTHSTFQSYATSSFIYPSLRIFHHPHPTSNSSLPAPLLVLIHGLGGSVAQFAPIIPFLSPHYSLLAIDLPGCGRSSYSETAYAAYSHAAMAELLAVIIYDIRSQNPLQPILVLGHSMGTALVARLSHPKLTPIIAERLHAAVTLCPVTGPPDPMLTAKFRKLMWLPEWIIDLWRMYDRRGGLESASVLRYAGEGAPQELREKQLRYNSQNRTGPWKRMSAGLLADGFTQDGKAIGGMSGTDIWREVGLPVLLIGGENDHVTKAEGVEIVAEAIREGQRKEEAAETVILPAPANHALLYDARFVPEVAQRVNEFFSKHVTFR